MGTGFPPARSPGNTAKVEPGAKAIVSGLGGIGLNVIEGLRLAGADVMIGADINMGFDLMHAGESIRSVVVH